LVLIFLANGTPQLGYAANLEWIGMCEFAGYDDYQDGPRYVGELADAGLLHWPDGVQCYVAYSGVYHPHVDWDEPKTLRKRVRALIDRDGDGCRYCKKIFPHYHVDHVIPRSRGGPDEMDNLVLACPACNMAKGAQTPTEWLGKPPWRTAP
jgi:hypothetical protein